MNIFFLHFNTNKCAKYHCSKHVIKMILESIQLLCAAHHILPNKHNTYTPPYKLTHKNHPCSIWVRKSQANYLWLCSLTRDLSKEYTYRYGKIHLCERNGYIHDLFNNIPDIPDEKFFSPPLCMPDHYKNENIIKSYRNYYIYDKTRMLNWGGKVCNRETPRWYLKHLEKEKEEQLILDNLDLSYLN